MTSSQHLHVYVYLIQMRMADSSVSRTLDSHYGARGRGSLVVGSHLITPILRLDGSPIVSLTVEVKATFH